MTNWRELRLTQKKNKDTLYNVTIWPLMTILSSFPSLGAAAVVCLLRESGQTLLRPFGFIALIF